MSAVQSPPARGRTASTSTGTAKHSRAVPVGASSSHRHGRLEALPPVAEPTMLPGPEAPRLRLELVADNRHFPFRGPASLRPYCPTTGPASGRTNCSSPRTMPSRDAFLTAVPERHTS
jgi:hypothetical protein